MPSARADRRRRSRLHVMVSTACNNRCVFCLEDRAARARADFSDQVQALTAYPQRDAVLFTCGEPTLSAELVTLIATARDLGYADLELVTNGRRMSYAPYARELLAAGLTAVTISIHGDSSRVHDGQTRVRGSYNQSMAGLRNLAELAGRHGRPHLTVSTVVTRRTLPHLQSTVTTLARAGARRVIVNLVEPEAEARASFDRVVPRMTDAAAVIAQVVPPSGIEYRVEGLPPCLLPGLDRVMGDREVISLWRGGRIVRLRATRRQRQGPPCRACALAARCDGVWIEYARRFGWAEFGGAR